MLKNISKPAKSGPEKGMAKGIKIRMNHEYGPNLDNLSHLLHCSVDCSSLIVIGVLLIWRCFNNGKRGAFIKIKWK